MKSIAIGVHLLREGIEPLAEAVPVGDLFLSAFSVADDQPLGDRELLLKIESVRAKLLDVATFIAIRYGFAFTSADDAQSKCAAHAARWKRVLTENRGHVEMTLKVAASSVIPRPTSRHGASISARTPRHGPRMSINISRFRGATDRTARERNIAGPTATRNPSS
jgi:hypothetical protein